MTKPNTEKRSLPLVLGEYARDDAARFHMPGHKGRGMGYLLPQSSAKWDVTELEHTDNLHEPTGCIADTEAAVAAAYGAERSFLLVNGSTAAVEAMILSLLPTDKLLLYRDCHRSALSGAALSGVPTVLSEAIYDESTGLMALPTPDSLEKALLKTHATAVLVTSPNAYGYCADLKGLSAVAHRHGALLLVDAAHGAHFPFSDLLPEGAAGYADMWGHSQHKTLNSLTQTATLHLSPCRIEASRVQRALSLIQTTSPSYLFMASIDWSVFMAAREDWKKQIDRCERLRDAIGEIDGLTARSPMPMGAVDCDQTRIVIDVSGRGITGFDADRILRENGVYVEMADFSCLVLITAPADDPAWDEKLIKALRKLPMGSARTMAFTDLPKRAVRKLSIREAALAKTVSVPLEGAAGCIAGEGIGLYPPGIALCTAGEVLTKKHIELLLRAERAGASLFGVHGGRIAAVEEDA